MLLGGVALRTDRAVTVIRREMAVTTNQQTFLAAICSRMKSLDPFKSWTQRQVVLAPCLFSSLYRHSRRNTGGRAGRRLDNVWECRSREEVQAVL